MLEGENISFEEHRELQEVLMDPAHLDEYIVVRRERLPDGKFGGFLVASGEIAEEVYVSFKKDKQINKNATYYFLFLENLHPQYFCKYKSSSFDISRDSL